MRQSGVSAELIMLRLEITYPHGRRTSVGVTRPEVIIGRDADCDVPLEDASTSRRHARFYQQGSGQYWIRDLQSKNGTRVNRQRVSIAQVREGDQIEIGDCVLTLVLDSQPLVVLSDAGTETVAGGASAWKADQRFELPQQRLERLYELNERLTGRFDRDDLLAEVLDVCIESLRFERAGVGTWRGPGHPVEWIRFRDLRGKTAGELRISRSLVDRALHHAERVLINDTADGDPTASMISNNIRSAMCVPMMYLQQVHGVMYGDRVTTTGGYGKEDIDFFAALGRLAAMGLANVKLVEELQYRRQVEIQLQWGRQIQAHLFPSGPLVRPGLTIHALNDPGEKISGDYYDYFVRPDGLIVLVIADVAGKGIPASLLTANLQAAVHLLLVTETDLPRAVRDLNTLICRNVVDSRFITAIIGLLDPGAGTFTAVGAGHPWPLLLRGDGRVDKPPMETGLPLGIDADFPYQASVVRMEPSPTTLFVYTDGIPEAENDQREMFGEARLLEALAVGAAAPPDELPGRVRRSIKQFARNYPQTDDITMVAARLGE